MKKSRLFITAIALMGIAACAKMETPTVQEEPEVIAPEQTVAAKSEQTADVKSVACTLNSLCQICEVRDFIKSFIVKVNKSEETPWHLDIYVAKPKTEEQEEFPYISGSVGFVKGIFHPVVLDVDLKIVKLLTIAGTIDVHQIVGNYSLAIKHLDSTMGDLMAQYYLDKATEGLDITIQGTLRFFFQVEEDEGGNRYIDLYLHNPDDPTYEPVSVKDFLDMFTPKG